MYADLRNEQEVIANFNKEYARIHKRGIFTKNKREKIMRTKGIAGRDVKKADFWQDVRDHIRAALIDLELFLTFARDSDIELVMTIGNLYPLIKGLLFPRQAQGEPDLRKAEIAQAFIRTGFHYLNIANTPAAITLSHKRTINEALDLANYLTQALKPEKERNYISGDLLP
jgi:hypothetical protein